MMERLKCRPDNNQVRKSLHRDLEEYLTNLESDINSQLKIAAAAGITAAAAITIGNLLLSEISIFIGAVALIISATALINIIVNLLEKITLKYNIRMCV